ncbi:MAG: aspartate aminotransferase family protein, partial [Pseudomonadota bacterium]
NKTKMPEAKSLQMYETEQKYIAAGLQSIASKTKMALSHGQGSTITDVDGNTYIDFVAGVCVASVGHAHPKYVKAISDQVGKISVGSQTTENRLRFLERLVPLLPGELSRIQFYSSGAEAVEAAVRLAKSYTKKFELVSFTGGFHGKTNLTMALSSGDLRYGLGPFVPGIHVMPYGDCYRCPIKMDYPQCDIACIDVARKQLKRESAGAIAAIILEPIQGTAGNVVPPAEFIRGVWEIAREFDALVIADEMITGFGRTGRMFGCDNWGVVPDIMVMGKGIASGFPLSAIATTDEINKAEPFAKPSGSSSSYGGNPLASAAARAALDIILDEGLVENSARMGEHMLGRLKDMSSRYSFLGDIRGRGLMIGVDLVADRDTRELLSRDLTERLFQEALRRGLLAFVYSPRIRLNPPLVIDKKTLDAGLDMLDESFEVINKIA